MRRFDPLILIFALAALTTPELAAQPPGGPGGPGGPGAPDVELVEEFDRNDDGRLDREERAAARKSLQSQGDRRGGPGGGRGPRGPRLEPGAPGVQVSVDEAEVFADQPLYDPAVLRTLFLTFENEDWEQELADFKPTDVEVPAKMIVDGKEYDDVGVSFRGASSFFMIPSGLKRSFNISLDHANEDQDLYGYRTLNLLNSNGDPSMLSTILYSWIAGQKIATPKANYVKVVVNGENWGIYCNVEQFNSDFTKEHFDSKKGARWKVNGSPRGDGGLRYLGDDIEPYRTRFEIKSKDKESSWRDLIELCKVLNETPDDQLEEKLDPIMDVDGALWFLAVDNALINSDGYWTRASDYSIYQDPKGKFHILPHDMNEAFRGARGGRGGGPGGGRGGGRGGPGGGPGGPGGGPGAGPPPGGPGFGPPPGEPGGRPEFGGRGGPDGPGGRAQGGRGGEGGRGGQGGRGGEGGRPDFGGPGGPGGGRGGPGGGPGGPGGGPGGPGGDRNGLGNIALDPLVGLDDDSKPLRSKLLANEELKKRYLQYVKEIASEMLDWQAVEPHVRNTRDLLTDEMQSDTRKLFTNDAFLAATSLDPVAKDEDVRSIRAFAEKRAGYLLGLDEIKGLPAKGASATKTRSTNRQPTVTVSSLKQAKSPLSIHEVMANNKSTVADPQGKFDDWIELHNGSDTAIDLSGYFLSDDEENAHKWAFPKGTTIAPGGFLIVWADEDGGDAPGLHANFKLSQKGERIFLTNGQSLLSELSFPAQEADQSFGVVDGSAKALKPSPGKDNASAP